MTRWIAGMLIAGLSVFSLATGCVNQRPSKLDLTFGEAYHANRAAMIADPQAGDQALNEGIDPNTAEHVLQNYDKHQKAQQHGGKKESLTSGIVFGEIQ